MNIVNQFKKVVTFVKSEDDAKFLDLYNYIRCTYHYLSWCIRYPRLLAHRCFIGRGADLLISHKAELRFGHDVYFMSNFCGDFYGNVVLGNKVIFQPNCRMTIHSEVRIGDYTGCAEGVSIHDETHPITGGDDPHNARPLVTKPIVIGKNVWIGAKATILQGVTIGDNAVIGAHSLVTSDIPANAVAVGTPARIVRIVETTLQKTISQQELKLSDN